MSTLMPTMNSSFTTRLAGIVRPVAQGFNFLAPLGDLILRLWVAQAFWMSGLTKIQSFDTTVQLFENEYQVPLLPPVVAAYAGTFTELFFPVLLVLGLGGRFAALVLFVFNIIAVISYPDLNAAGLFQHQAWGLGLLILLLHGPGKISFDHWIGKWYSKT
jgi:putative oxidoreductase